jgi:peroxiredoxin Q/BCP
MNNKTPRAQTAELHLPAVGSQAPEFTLPDQFGAMQSLREQRGKWVLVYFYPKDDTPGCTKEACMIRDGFPLFEKLDVTIFGVSVDSIVSHKKFADKYHLPFTLLSDVDKHVVSAYGVWGKKRFMGREYYGTNRCSFLIAPDGTIAKVYPTVDPAIHADEVLRDLEALKKVGD